MKKFEILSRWYLVKEALKKRYQQLSDDDLTLRFGREGELIYRLQQKLGKSRNDIMKMIGEY